MKLGIVVAAVALLPVTGWAQGTLQTWNGMDATGLSIVHVLDDAGEEATGRLLRLDQNSLVILVEDQEVRFESHRVQRLDKRGDSLRNGAVMGALVGAALGVLATKEVGFTVVGAGVYAAIGTGFDALIQGRTTLYEAPGRNSARQNRSGRAGGAEVMALRATVSW